MVRYSPVILAVLLIVGLTIVQINMTDRLSGTNVSAEQRASLLEKVPSAIGDWHGEDMAIDAGVRKTAGAVGAVQREYHNVRTGEKVRVWLIVGHAREISAHTPDICYPSQGFQARASENSVYPMVFSDVPKADFLTNTFLRQNATGQQIERVFWSWYNPMDKENEGKVVWEAPSNARWHFGNTRALYKLYFTSSMRDPKETTEQSACMRFAKEALPEINKALSDVPIGDEVAEKSAATTAPPAEPKSDVAKPAETVAEKAASADSKAAESTEDPVKESTESPGTSEPVSPDKTLPQ